MTSTDAPRWRTACDECRKKKVKCGGESPTCLRCHSASTICSYSLQEVMGRPKKRPRKRSFEPPNDSVQTNLPAMPSMEEEPARFHPNAASEDAVAERLMETTSWDAGEMSCEPPCLTDSTSHGASTYTLPWDAPMPSLEPTELDPEVQPCACLSAMYLALDSLRALQDFTFPFALHSLRDAVVTGWNVVHCQYCPRLFLTATQNVQLLGLLLVSLTERYLKVLKAIDAETERSRLSKETKAFRIGDVSSSNSHLHTGDLNCPASLALELQPSEWSSIAKRVVKNEIYGSDDRVRPTLFTLIQRLEARQHMWHTTRMVDDAPEFRKDRIGDEEPFCLALAGQAKQTVSAMAFD